MIETPASQNSLSTSAASKPGRVEHVAATEAYVTTPEGADQRRTRRPIGGYPDNSPRVFSLPDGF